MRAPPLHLFRHRFGEIWSPCAKALVGDFEKERSLPCAALNYAQPRRRPSVEFRQGNWRLNTQGKASSFKGVLHSTSKAKKRKSLVISNPIPCNTAFPTDHVSLHAADGENGKDTVQGSEENAASSFKDSSDSEFSSSGSNSPQRQSVCEQEETESLNQEEVEVEVEDELAENQSDDSGVGVPKSEAANQEVSEPCDAAESELQEEEKDEEEVEEEVSEAPSSKEEGKPKAPPVPTPRVSFHCTDKPPLLPPKEQEEEETEEASDNQEKADSGEDSTSHNPPGFLHKVYIFY
ncbi:nucleolin-like [Notothenia coriiceps]|uniref:Nucleolin-like n=1 Tax=Notothenia coriiceps TaxID=8208 RepID=A0A6I9MZ36_9TELE|nr:PREDICTED: nucleolin-like [Notothenia coriiceps]